MIESKAYIVALMLLIASPIAIASDEGQAVLERFSNTPDDLVDVEKNDRTEALDDLLKEDILNDVPTDKIDTKDVVEDCYTLEQWKERLSDYDWDKEDWEKESDEVREEEERDDEDDRARGGDDGSDEEEDDGEHSHADDKADDHSHDDDEADDHNHVTDRYDENWEEIRAVMQELAEACEDGDEEACVDLREMIAEMMDDRKEKDWDQGWDRKEKDWDADACLTMEEWKKIFDDDKDDRKDDRKGDDDRKKRGPHRDVFVREIIEDLEIACNENDEEACEELEAMLAELEEKEGSCDKERDDEEHDERDDDDESDEEEQDQDDSEDDDPENA